MAGEIATRVRAGARPRDFAILVRANADADPVLRSLNVVGVPWRFSGTSGLYARPEIRLLLALLRGLADLSSSVDMYALATSDVYGLGGEDMTAIVNSARRRNRSLWEVMEELTRQPGLLRLEAATRAALEHLVGDVREFSEMAHQRPAGEVLYRFLRQSGMLARLAATESVAAEESLQNIARFFAIVRSQSDLLPDDRVVFVARHLQTLIDAGDDPATAELDPDADAVAVLTVHKAKGLEFPTVFMMGLVDGRFPARTRREPLGLPVELVDEVLPEGDPRLQEERRLFFVGMTRARDELILTHAADYGGRRARRVSQFVLEALDRPVASAVAMAAAEGARSPLESLASFEPKAPPAEPGRSADRGAADAELLPGRRLPDVPAQVQVRARPARADRPAPLDRVRLGAAPGRPGVPPPPRPGLRHDRGGAGRGLRASLVQRGLPDPRARGGPPSSGPGGAAPLPGAAAGAGGGRADVRRARVQLPAGRRPDPRPNGPRGRRRLGRGGPGAQPGGMASPERVVITDYKSSDVRDPVRARERARDSLQLQIYALAYEAETGRLPDALQLWFLESGLVGRVGGRPEAAGQGPRVDPAGRGRHPRPALRGGPRLPVLLVLRFPGHLPLERGSVIAETPGTAVARVL